jgi:hypothetical protein
MNPYGGSLWPGFRGRRTRAVPLLGTAGAGIAMMTALVTAPVLAAEELA